MITPGEQFAQYSRHAIQPTFGKVGASSKMACKVAGVQKLNRLLAADSRAFSTIITSIGVKYYDGMAIAVVN